MTPRGTLISWQWLRKFPESCVALEATSAYHRNLVASPAERRSCP